jgi:molybdopterin molybdotransferase
MITQEKQTPTRPGLLSFDEAMAQLLSAAAPVQGAQSVATMEALNRILAEDIVSGLNVPPMDNTQMDGYALRAQDISDQALPVSQRIPAGQVGSTLRPGTVARIFTGAMIPEGADTVVMQEQVEQISAAQGETPAMVLVKHQAKPGEWIRRAGEDIRVGATMLAAGTLLSPQALGLAASVGVAMVSVKPRVKVACFFTGDELAMPGELLKPGAIYNSNRFVLVNSLRALGCEVRDLGIVPDTLAATREALRDAASGSDLILTSGGVSVGEEDHVKPAVEAEGELNMWQIAMKPGKPLAYGKVRRPGIVVTNAVSPSAHFIGLPGNPVSSLVTFLLFVKPFVRILQGMSKERAQAHLRAIMLRADFNWPKADKRREFLRVCLNANGGLDLFENQSSAVLTSTVWADGLLDNPPMQTIAKGDLVRFIPMAGLQQ